MSLNQSASVSSSRDAPDEVSWGDDPEDAKPLTAAEKKKAKAAADKAKKAAKKGGQGKLAQVEEAKPTVYVEPVEVEPTPAVPASAPSPTASSSRTPQSEVQPVSEAEQHALNQPEPESPFSQGVPVSSVGVPAPAATEDDEAAVQVLPVPASVASTHLIDETAAPSPVAAPTTTVPAPSRSPPPSSRYPDVPLSKCPSFIAFRASVQKQRCVVGSKTWTYFDLGPRDVTPLICIPGTSGTAEMFFFQMMELGNRGYRIISVSPPAYYTHDDWCNGFNGFLYSMGLTGEPKPSSPNAPSSSAATSSSSSPNAGKVHVFANSLAGYLMLYYVSHVIPAKNFIASLVICNSFNDTSFYQQRNGSSGWCIALLKRAPAFIVRKYILDSMPECTLFPDAVDFMVEQLEDNLPTEILASRLILNILKNRGVAAPNLWRNKEGETFPQENITIMDVSDAGCASECALHMDAMLMLFLIALVFSAVRSDHRRERGSRVHASAFVRLPSLRALRAPEARRRPALPLRVRRGEHALAGAPATFRRVPQLVDLAQATDDGGDRCGSCVRRATDQQFTCLIPIHVHALPAAQPLARGVGQVEDGCTRLRSPG
jgi:pimeloyl-ACP methyl ester carboxylesterase